MMMRFILVYCFWFNCFQLSSQAFINGDFENNNANNTDQINLSNSVFNTMLPSVISFGSYGDVDIIKSSLYGSSGAQQGNWYIAITGGGTDAITLKLNKPLIAGNTYSLSFYERKVKDYVANAIEIGLSKSFATFGEPIFKTTELAIENVWSQRLFSFTAPISGLYISVQMPIGGITNWVHLDNFSIGPISPSQTITPIITQTLQPLVTDTIVKSLDTIVTTKNPLKFNQHKLNGRKLHVQQKVNVTEPVFKLLLWDKNKIDGDVVSVFLNGELVEENINVTKIKKELVLHLQNGINYLTMQAVNLGRTPPNTAAIGYFKDGRLKISTLISDMKSSGVFEIVYHADEEIIN